MHLDKVRVLSFSPSGCSTFDIFLCKSPELAPWCCTGWHLEGLPILQVKSPQKSPAACHSHLEEFTLCAPQSPWYRCSKCCRLHLKSALCCTVLFPAASSALGIYIYIIYSIYICTAGRYWFIKVVTAAPAYPWQYSRCSCTGLDITCVQCPKAVSPKGNLSFSPPRVKWVFRAVSSSSLSLLLLNRVILMVQFLQCGYCCG